MNDALRVRRIQSVRNLNCQVEHPVNLQKSATVPPRRHGMETNKGKLVSKEQASSMSMRFCGAVGRQERMPSESNFFELFVVFAVQFLASG